jgi:response regulator RpfG family c-di-GMP phosphodiesterase
MSNVTSKGRVLVLDDEPAVCALLSERLTLEGYNCKTCSSGEEALAAMERESFDLVISDIRMPGMSGMEFLAEAHQRHPHSAYLMATAEDDVRVGIQAMKQGAADYLVKPIQLESLLASVQRALDVKRMEAELENYRRNLEEMVGARTKQLQSAMRRIELTYDETLEALGAALDLRDTETAGHSERVRRYCLEMATAIGCSQDELKQISRGAYLHDIGKIGIPDSILLKEGKLTAEEMAVMQSHVRIGYDLVCRVAFLAPAAAIVLTHQERYDGTGYPQGLMGNEIPIGSRVFAIADTLDAMTSDRPYRRALPISAARAEVQRESGRQFDPEIVRVFLSIPDQAWEDIRMEVAGQRAAGRGMPVTPSRSNPAPSGSPKS